MSETYWATANWHWYNATKSFWRRGWIHSIWAGTSSGHGSGSDFKTRPSNDREETFTRAYMCPTSLSEMREASSVAFSEERADSSDRRKCLSAIWNKNDNNDLEHIYTGNMNSSVLDSVLGGTWYTDYFQKVKSSSLTALQLNNIQLGLEELCYFQKESMETGDLKIVRTMDLLKWKQTRRMTAERSITKSPGHD